MDVIFDMVERGPQRLGVSGDDGPVAHMLSTLYFVDKREWNDGKHAGTKTFALPEELQDVILDNMELVEALRDFGDTLEMYANSAAILYGVVSLKEILDIEKRYHQDGGPATGENDFNEKNLKIILIGRHDEESEWFMHGDLVCHNEFYHGNESEVDEVIDEFLEERGDKPRWYPQTDDEFLGYSRESANLETPEAKALSKWLSKNGLRNLDKRTDALYEALYGIQYASTFIEVIEKRQGLKVACLEEIAYKRGWINSDQLRKLAEPMAKNDYGKYLLRIAEEK